MKHMNLDYRNFVWLLVDTLGSGNYLHIKLLNSTHL